MPFNSFAYDIGHREYEFRFGHQGRTKEQRIVDRCQIARADLNLRTMGKRRESTDTACSSDDDSRSLDGMGPAADLLSIVVCRVWSCGSDYGHRIVTSQPRKVTLLVSCAVLTTAATKLTAITDKLGVMNSGEGVAVAAFAASGELHNHRREIRVGLVRQRTAPMAALQIKKPNQFGRDLSDPQPIMVSCVGPRHASLSWPPS